LRGMGVGVETFWTKVAKGTPLCKSGRINRLGYVAVAVFEHYRAARKKTRERPFEFGVVCNTASP